MLDTKWSIFPLRLEVKLFFLFFFFFFLDVPQKSDCNRHEPPWVAVFGVLELAMRFRRCRIVSSVTTIVAQ